MGGGQTRQGERQTGLGRRLSAPGGLGRALGNPGGPQAGGPEEQAPHGNQAFAQDNGVAAQPTGDDGLDDAFAELERALDGLPPGVPTYEAITSSTGAETSRTDQIETANQIRWNHDRLDYTDAARELADQDLGDGGNRTRSAITGEGVTYAQRWGVHMICNHFTRPGGDLPEWDQMMADVQASQGGGGFDQSMAVPNPTGGELRDAIMGAVHRMTEALDGQPGQLTVSIATHGGQGFIRAADTEAIQYAELEQMAMAARRNNVHVVYVIDACLSGDMVVRANEAAADEAELDALMTEATGGDASGARARLATARQLMEPLTRLNRNGGQLRSLSRHARSRSADDLAAFNETLSRLAPDLDVLESLLESLEFPESEQAAVQALEPLLQRARMGVLMASEGGVDRVSAGMHGLAEFLDPMNGIVSRLIEGATTP